MLKRARPPKRASARLLNFPGRESIPGLVLLSCGGVFQRLGLGEQVVVRSAVLGELHRQAEGVRLAVWVGDGLHDIRPVPIQPAKPRTSFIISAVDL